MKTAEDTAEGKVEKVKNTFERAQATLSDVKDIGEVLGTAGGVGLLNKNFLKAGVQKAMGASSFKEAIDMIRNRRPGNANVQPSGQNIEVDSLLQEQERSSVRRDDPVQNEAIIDADADHEWDSSFQKILSNVYASDESAFPTDEQIRTQVNDLLQSKAPVASTRSSAKVSSGAEMYRQSQQEARQMAEDRGVYGFVHNEQQYKARLQAYGAPMDEESEQYFASQRGSASASGAAARSRTVGGGESKISVGDRELTEAETQPLITPADPARVDTFNTPDVPSRPTVRTTIDMATPTGGGKAPGTPPRSFQLRDESTGWTPSPRTTPQRQT